MKVLKFLVNAPYSSLLQNLVGYLIDAGHLVFIYSENEEVNSKWKAKYKHNLYVVSKEKLSSREFDYVIDAEGINLNSVVPKINFSLNLTNDNFIITTLLEQNGDAVGICENILELDNTFTLEQNLEYFINEITEVFIDSIVHLLRFGDDNLMLSNNIIQHTLNDFCAYEHSLGQLNIYYKALENDEDLFLVQHLIAFSSQNVSWAKSTLKLSHQQISLNRNNLELLVVYLLSLLNARQEGTYGYELYISNSETNNAGSKLSKFIEVNIRDSHISLSERLNNTLYNIANSRFYYGTSSSNVKNIKPNVAVLYNNNSEVSEYLLSLAYDSMENELIIRYRKDLYFFENVEVYLDNFLNKLGKFTSGTISFKELLDLPQAYFSKYLIDWNDISVSYLDNKTIHLLFEEQVKQTPYNIALVFEDTKLTYRELNKRANRLAHLLIQAYNIKPDSLVCLCFDRGTSMVIAILATLKAGGAYVPIDPSYPDDRIKYILGDTGSKVILTNMVYVERLTSIAKSVALVSIDKQTESYIDEKSSKISVLGIDHQELQEQLLSRQPFSNPDTKTTSTNLAYIIYTSGTTGNPKGVMIEHKGVVNLKSDLTDRYGFSAQDNEIILQFANYVFDASVEQMVIALLNGYTLLLVPNQLWWDKDEFYHYLNLNHVTYIEVTPSLLEQYDFSNVNSLKRLVLGGEKVSLDCYRRIKLGNNCKIINTYGPTETTITCMVNVIQNDDISIGYPISNVRCFVLDNNLMELPMGVVGELYVGGLGLARGYLNKPELTREKFINYKFKTQKGNYEMRLYKTGDLVKYSPEGYLEYIGRNDSQVKIRGYRIELNEIENVLLAYNGVRQTIVRVVEHKAINNIQSSQNLVGYYLSDTKLKEEEILGYLRSRLPEYMVPTVLIHLNFIPLTINGKLDHKALPQPEFTNSNNYKAPRNNLESKLCAVWAEVLNLSKDSVGICDNFFRLGGNSIFGIKLLSRLKQELKHNITIKDIFVHNTIEKFYDNVLLKNDDDRGLKIKLSSKERFDFDTLPLSPIQHWFFTFNATELIDNQFKLFFIKTPNLDLGRLEASLGELLERHDIFRLRLASNSLGSSNNTYDGIYFYKALDDKLQLDVVESKGRGTDKIAKEIIQPFLSFGTDDYRVCRIYYINGYGGSSSRICIASHSILMNASSIRLLAEDLMEIYHKRTLRTVNVSYMQWAVSVKEHYDSHKEETEYWLKLLSDYNNYCSDNVIGKLQPITKNFKNYLHFSLNNQQTASIIKEVGKAYDIQIEDILLAALSYTLLEINCNKTNYVMILKDVREHVQSTIDISKTVGCFNYVYPLKLESRDTISSSINSIKHNLRYTPNNGIGYGSLVGYEAYSLPKIIFSYLGKFNNKNNSKNSDDFWDITSKNISTLINREELKFNVVNITFVIINNELKCSVLSKLDIKFTKKLSDLINEALERIVTHFDHNSSEHAEFVRYTMSDFLDFEPYVTFDNIEYSHDKPVLFMFPPRNSGAESYFNSIKKSLNYKNIILFNNYHLYLSSKFGSDYAKNMAYEVLAEEYINHIKSIQPGGEYNFFGWSMGGVLAYEIARQLIRMGDVVRNIVMVDSFFNWHKIGIKTNNPMDEINYRYRPDRLEQDVNIILFKALEVENLNSAVLDQNDPHVKSSYQICKYYTDNVVSNHLDDIVQHENLRVIPMNCSHYSWITNKKQVKQICYKLEGVLKINNERI